MNRQPSFTASERGKADAQAVDRRLRQVERRERDERLTSLVLRHDAPAAVDLGASNVERLERQVARLADYQRAVHDSAAWRLAQAARRLLGRKAW